MKKHKIIRVCTDMYQDAPQELLNSYLEDGWLVVNVVSTQSSSDRTYFNMVFVIEKETS